MKKIKKLARRVIAIIIIAFIILLFRNIIYNFMQKGKTKQTRVLLNNELISVSDNIYVEDSIIYISQNDIKEIFDKNIYYSDKEKELITTYNKHIAVMHLNENEVIINDANIKIEGTLKEIDSKIFLPISDLEIVYDIEVQYSDKANVVIIDSINLRKSEVIVIGNTSIKQSKMPFSLPIEKVKRGECLYVLEDAGRYKKVRSSLGNIGYVKNRKISNEEVIRENLKEEITELNILQEYNNINETYENVKINLDKENFVIVDSFESCKDSGIINLINNQKDDYEKYLEWAEKNDIGVIGNFKNGLVVSKSLASYSQRNKIINELYNETIKNRQKGICLDYTEIDDIDSFNRFLIEITPKFKESGLKIIVKLNNQLDKEKVKNIVDFTI